MFRISLTRLKPPSLQSDEYFRAIHEASCRKQAYRKRYACFFIRWTIRKKGDKICLHSNICLHFGSFIREAVTMAKRPKTPMDVAQRAKIFAPFDALRGFRSALREKERLVLPKRQLLEDQLAKLDETARRLKPGCAVTVVYYREGDYLSVSGTVTGIDPVNKTISLSDRIIPFDDIYELEELRELSPMLPNAPRINRS